MAVYLFSRVKGTALNFVPNSDVLSFDEGSAADLNITVSGTTLVLRQGAESVTLLNVSQIASLTTANVTFADGSRLLVGDNTTGTSGDAAANTLTGTAGNDRIIGLRGNDTVDGRDGSDTYVITGNNDGTDIYRDTGVTGIDVIIASANNAIIRLGTSFSHALTGIEAISGGGFGGVSVQGSTGADTLNFTGMNLSGLALLDARAGNDAVTGSSGDDTISGGSGNDTIDGGDGRDTAVFAGARAAYRITDLGGAWQVQDLDSITNGNDGTDTLRNVELLQFVDQTVDLTVPPPPPPPPPAVPANSAPVAAADTFAATEDQSHLIDVLANDTDANAGDAIRLMAIDRTGTLGQTAFATSGGRQYVYYTPVQSLKAGEAASDRFSYTIADAAGALSTASVAITVTGVNDAPTAFADNVSMAANSGPATLNVLANDTDPDAGDSKTVVSFDGSGRPASFYLVVNGEVTFPVAIPAIAPLVGTVSVANGGQGLVYSPGTAFAYLRAGQTVTDTVFYTMVDSAGAQSTNTATVTLIGANDGPAAVNDIVAVAKNSAPVSVNVLANDTDADAGDTRAVVSVNTTDTLGSVAVAAGGGSVVYSVGNAFADLAEGTTGTDSFSYTMTDALGAQSTARVTVTITGANSAPVAVADLAAATENGAAVLINVLANDTDVNVSDGKTVVTVDNTGAQGVASIAAGGGGVVYSVGGAFQSLRAGQTATDTFTYTMADSAGARASASVTVTVTGVTDAPVAIADAATVAEDGGAVTLNVLANDSDIDAGDNLSLASIIATGLRGSAVIDGSTIVYTPNHQSLRAGQSLVDTFSYRVVDGAGAQATATVSVTVIGANDAPVAVDDVASLSEDAVGATLRVLVNDTDVDAGDTRRVLSVDGAGALGTVSVAAGGAGVVYNAGNAFQHLLTGQSVVETFSYTLADTAGATSTASVTVTINGATDGPRAVADTAAAAEDGGPITLHVLANDSNDANPGGTLTIAAIDVLGRLGGYYVTGSATGNTQYGFDPGLPRLLGQASIAADGLSILYTPLQSLNQGEVGVDTFHYTVAGGSSTVVTITVTGVNDAPTALDDSATVAADGAPLTINVLANDADPDTRNDPLPPPLAPNFDLLDLSFDATPADVPDTRTVISVNNSGLQGSVAIAAGGSGVVYTVGGALQTLMFGQSVVETFGYTMQDGAGVQSSATVSVTVTGVNHAPAATNDTAAASENGAPLTIDVLANDSDGDIAAGDTLAVIALDGAGLQGSVVIDGGSVVYNVGTAFQSLRAGATATDTFGYTIADSSGAQSAAQVTVSVAGVNDAPVAVADVRTVSEDSGAVTIPVLANDTDVDLGDTRTVISLNTAGLQGSVTISADGLSVIYTPASAFQTLLSGQTANESFGYTITDSAGAQATALVSVTIIGANEPVAVVTPPPPPPGAIVGGADDDVLNGTAGADILYGQAGDDDILAGDGADVLFGGADDDTLAGDGGNDTLVGGAGRDDLTGGAGADVFRFYLASDSLPTGIDRIRDFTPAQGDKIDLNLIDANTILGGNDDFALAASFTGAAGQLIHGNTAAGYTVQGDVNGDAVADFTLEVRLAGAASLSAADFLL